MHGAAVRTSPQIPDRHAAGSQAIHNEIPIHLRLALPFFLCSRRAFRYTSCKVSVAGEVGFWTECSCMDVVKATSGACHCAVARAAVDVADVVIGITSRRACLRTLLLCAK